MKPLKKLRRGCAKFKGNSDPERALEVSEWVCANEGSLLNV
jgi:hypothetical protein